MYIWWQLIWTFYLSHAPHVVQVYRFSAWFKKSSTDEGGKSKGVVMCIGAVIQEGRKEVYSSGSALLCLRPLVLMPGELHGESVFSLRPNKFTSPASNTSTTSHSFIVLNMGLEWRGPHRTLLVRLLHYVWIHIHYVNVDGNDRALELRCWMHLVPPYYGAPQTKPGVQYNNDERNDK